MPFRFSSLFRVTVACTVLFATTASQAKADELWYAALHWNGSQSQQRISTIRSIRDDGSYDREVFNLGGDTTYPIPSPEGDWLYFQVGDSPGLQGRYRVHRGRVDGSEVRDLGALHNLGATWTTSRGPSVAGNGSKLMYNVSNGSEDRLIIANPDGTNARFVASELGYSYMGSFDRNGTRIVFANPTRSYELFSQLLSGGALTALTPGTIGNFIPQFTPDDSKIIFKRGFGLSEIWSMTPTGQNQTQLTANSNYGGFYWNTNDEHGSSDWPDISSDGSRIAYVARGPGAVAHVYTMKLDGTDNKQVTNLSGDCARVRFSPDGKRLAFVSFVGSYPQLFVVDALGATSPKQLTNSTVRGVYWVRWKPTALMTVENMTRRDVLFADDFEHVPASAAPALDLSGDYDPVAVVGTWNAVEGAHEPKGYAQIQVVRSGSGGDPGSPRAGNYLRVFRSAADGVRHQDLFGTFNASAAQIQANDVIRWSMMVNVPADGANARATFLLLGAPGNLNTARAWVRTDGAGRVFSVGPGQVPQDTGIRYVPGAWQRWDLQYAVGSTKFSVSVGGASATDLSSLSAGNVGAVHLFNGSDARGSFYVSGAVEPPTFKVRNMTTGTTIFADDFESVPAAHDLTGPFEGDLDPTARIGHWDVFEGGSASAVPAMIQVTDDVRSIGTYQTSRALRVYRNLAAGLNEQDLNAVFSAPQAKVGDVIRLSAMVYIPNDGANARAQIMFVGTPGNVVTARAWVRPDGAGNVIAVGPGYVLRNTGVRYQPNAWQRWELEYAVGSLTFSVSVNGTKVTGLPSLSTGAVAAVEMPNGATSAGAYLVAGVTGD